MFWYIFGTTERQSLKKWNYRNGNFLGLCTNDLNKWQVNVCFESIHHKMGNYGPKLSWPWVGENGVAEMKNFNINFKSNNRKLCQQRAQQSIIKHFNVLPVIGHFFTLPHHIRGQSPLLFENFHEITPPLQKLSMKHWKNYIWNIWSI